MTCFCVSIIDSKQTVGADSEFYNMRKRALRRQLGCFEGKIRQNWGETRQNGVF